MSQSKRPSKNEPFGEIMRSMNQFFQEKPIKGFLQSMDDFFHNPFPFATSFHIRTEETEKEQIIKAELPGINREQIHIDVFDHFVTISIFHEETFTEEDEQSHIVKRKQAIQKSTRTIPLSQPVNPDHVKATYENGLLQIRIPKQKGKTIHIE